MNRTEAQSPVYFHSDEVAESDQKRIKVGSASSLPPVPPLLIATLADRARSPTDKRVEEASSAAFQSSSFATPPQQTKVTYFYPQQKGA